MNVFFIFFSFFIFLTCISENLACTKEIRRFVDGHNKRRLQVAKGLIEKQPSATKMKLMMWDKELAEKATQWASQNKNVHNPRNTIPSGRFQTGENLYWYSTTDRNYKLNVDLAIESWFSEHVNYTYGSLRASDFDNSRGYDIGHYTQLVWSDSIYLGCAVSQKFRGKWNTFFVVCNYGPAGNYIGNVPYVEGGPTQKLTCGCDKRDSHCNCRHRYGGAC